MIEGNRLAQELMAKAISDCQSYPGKERDHDEVRGYYAALDAMEQFVHRGARLHEETIQNLHALAMGGGKTRKRPTP